VKPLDFCDHITSGHSAYRCSAYRGETEERENESVLETARAGWSKAAVAEWEKLEPLAEAFFQAEASATTYGSRLGTAHVAMYNDALTDLRRSFTTMVSEANAFQPASVKGRLTDLDRELNALYRRVLQAAEGPEEEQIIRAAERAWVKYRDGMVSFFKAQLLGRHAPETIANAVLVRLTRERVEAFRAMDLPK
jgi:uncharacterized protein YecT (DUF1311 family)